MKSPHELLSLPEWPQCVITGKSVSVEQAADIISRTDDFFGYFDSYGNNGIAEADIKSLMGIAPYINHVKQAADVWGAGCDMNDVTSIVLRRVKTEYIKNDWISSSFIFGAHGWCHPDGTIAFTDNVGKWPRLEEINEDLVAIAEAFPYLDMAVTLMSGEQFDDNKSAVVTFTVKSGVVATWYDNHESHHAFKPPLRDIDKIDYTTCRHQGVSDEWIAALAARVKPLFVAAFPAFVERNPIAAPKH